MHLLPLNLGCLADHADPKEGARWAVTGVELQLTPGRYRATATDTKQVVTVDGPTVADADDYPTWPALDSAPNGHTRSMVGAKGWKSFFSDAGKVAGKHRLASHLKAVAVKVGAGVTTMGARDDTPEHKTQVFQNADGKFPPFDQIFPRRTPTASVYLDARLLAKVAGTLAKLSDDDNCGITLEIHDQYTPVVLHHHGKDGTHARALIMGLGGDNFQFPRPVTLDTRREAKAVNAEIASLTWQLEAARAEIARLTAALAATEVVPLVDAEAEPITTALAVWRQPTAVPAGPVRCAGCRKHYKYLKRHGQSCTRCLKKHGAAVVRDR